MEHDAGSTFFTGFENNADIFADRFLLCLKGKWTVDIMFLFFLFFSPAQ